MRNISTTALTQVTTKLGGEPLCIVAIYWDKDTPLYYCDRGAVQDHPELRGKILKLANLDDVVNISNASNSQSVSITLDDTLQPGQTIGEIKAIYDTRDIHKKKVIIYQWFTQINFNDKFVIFEGIINSPIVWVEKDRTLSFDVVSKLEDAEIGFSPEEGDFPAINDNLIGKAWPMPFGTVLKVPAVGIDLVGNATLMDSIGLHDPKLDADIQNLYLQQQYTIGYANALITSGSLLQTNSAGRGEGVGPFEENPDDPDFQQGAAMVQNGQKLLNETGKMDVDIKKIRIQITAQKKFEKTSVMLFNGTTFPTGRLATFEMGDLIVTGVISAVTGSPRGDSILNIHSVTTKKPFLTHIETGTTTVEKYVSADLSGTTDTGFPLDFGADLGLASEIDIFKSAPEKIIVDAGPGFVFVKAGTRIKWVSDLPQRWIAAMLPCTVLGVYAIRDYDGTKLMTAIPSNYYTVSYQNFAQRDGIGPGVTATVITLKQPLSYINDVELTTAQTGAGLVKTTTTTVNGQHLVEVDKRGSFFSLISSTFSSGWEDQIYVDLISPVGPNTADIMSYLVTTYSGVPYPDTPPFTCDPTTFNLARAQVNAAPMHFCLFERKNLFDVLKELAFQARCAVWLKENIFYLLYLVPEATPTDSITLDDIKEDSLELHHTSTEELVTKFVANYKIFYGPQTGFPASDIGSKDDKVILRANMAKYGLHEQQYQYYAYTNTRLVDLSSTFWIIRKANTWKLVQFNTPLHKLRIETFDSITIDLRSVCDEPVVGVVQSANLDTDAMQIAFSVWVPVRIGEMHKYPGGNPSIEFFYPYIHDEVGSQNVGETAGGDIRTFDNPNAISVSYDNRKRPHYGNPAPGQDLDPIVSPILDNTIGALDDTVPEAYPPVDQKYDLSTNPNPNLNISAIPARVRVPSPKDVPEYFLDSYPKGLGNPSVTAKAVDVTYGPDNTGVLETGTWVMIQPLTYSETKNGETKQHTIRYFLPSGNGTSTFPGVVTGGSGSTYTMNVYKKGLNGTPESVSVKQLQIANDSIPSGSWALVSKGSKTVAGVTSVEYTMQMPVWL